MKKIKTTVDQHQLGKKCNCFYKGKIHACEVIGFTRNHSLTACRIENTGMEVHVRSNCVNWTDDPKVEEIWLDNHEARQDRIGRLRETRKAMQQVIRDKISMNRKDVPREKVSKRRQQMEPSVLKALQKRMKSLCTVGSHAVSQLLNVLERHGETTALLYHLALEIEKKNLLCYQYNNSETRHFYWTDRKNLFHQLIEHCRKENIPYGHPDRNKDMVCVWLPGCEPLTFPVKQWLIETDGIPDFPYPCDGKHLMNIRRLEDAVTEKYGWYLRMRYPDRFAS